jgi:hypothetical protein
MTRPQLLSFAATVALLFGCRGAQTDDPVVTRSDDGKSTSPSGDAAAKRGTSLVRFVNALPGNGDLTIAADDRSLFAGVGFKSVTEYREIGDNTATFELRSDGTTNPLARNNEVMADGHRYTIIALSDDRGGATLRILRDELVTDSNKARVRVIHAVAGMDELDVTVQGNREPLFDDINHAMEAGFKDVDPMTATFEIRQDDRAATLVTLPSMQLAGGRAYTIIVTGPASKVTAITFDDAVVAAAPVVSLEQPR